MMLAISLSPNSRKSIVLGSVINATPTSTDFSFFSLSLSPGKDFHSSRFCSNICVDLFTTLARNDVKPWLPPRTVLPNPSIHWCRSMHYRMYNSLCSGAMTGSTGDESAMLLTVVSSTSTITFNLNNFAMMKVKNFPLKVFRWDMLV